jgi:hypothetical protein
VTTFADLSAPLALLRLLATDHPDLPAVNVLISKSSPNWLRLDIHGDLAVFEAWREALGLDPSTIRRNLLSADTTMVLSVSGTVADCHVELTSYSPNLSLLVEAVAA